MSKISIYLVLSFSWWLISAPIAQADSRLNVGIVTFQTSPRMCFNGYGFKPGDPISIAVSGVPSSTGQTINRNLGTVGHANSRGYFFAQSNSFQYANCTGNQAFGQVTVAATDGTTDATTAATVPSDRFCSNTVGTNYNNSSPSECDKSPPPIPARNRLHDRPYKPSYRP